MDLLVEVDRNLVPIRDGTCSRHLPRHGNGYVPVYRANELNHCPGCGMSQWIIGRITAECAFCGTALPLQHTGLEGISLGGTYWDRDVLRHGWHFGDSHKAATGKGEWPE